MQVLSSPLVSAAWLAEHLTDPDLDGVEIGRSNKSRAVPLGGGSNPLTIGDVPDPRPAHDAECISPRDGFRIPFAAGHTRRMPRLTAGPFRYMRYADAYLEASRRVMDTLRTFPAVVEVAGETVRSVVKLIVSAAVGSV